MKSHLTIGPVILKYRKDKRITQEMLADQVGVSKASVSKWELGQSFPDIALLPELATFFGITIDELLGYVPELSKEEIKEVYITFSQRFASEDPANVIKDVQQLMKKYYSCYPLQLMMGLLLMNHYMLLKNEEEVARLLSSVSAIFHRVSRESDEPIMRSQAIYYEAACKITENKPEDSIPLLDETIFNHYAGEQLLAHAYEVTNEHELALQTLQIGIYKNISALIKDMQMYASLTHDTPEIVAETFRRSEGIIDTFAIDQLQAELAGSTYLLIAYNYGMQKNEARTLHYLEKTIKTISEHMFPLALHGDDYFTKITPWMEDSPLGTYAPINEQFVKQSIIDSIVLAEQFVFLHENETFKELCEKVKKI